MSFERVRLIFLKDLKSIFVSPMFFVIGAFFALLMGWIFFNLLVTYLESVHNHMVNQSNLTFSDGVLKPFFSNMNFLLVLVTPIFTMRALATEQEKGTLDLLFSSAIRPWEIIIGKWLASWVSVFALIFMTLIIPLILFISNLPLGGVILSGYLAIMLNMTLYISLGIFLSSMTTNQSVAALMTLAGILFLWLIPWASQTSHNLLLIEIYRYLGVMTHFGTVLSGILSMSDLVYYLSSSFILMIGSIVILNRKRGL